MRSKLPFHRQEIPSSCAVACLRMILEHHGFVVSEAELRKRCQTSELGTWVESLLSRARALGFEAEIEYLTVERLRELLGEGVYPIAYINMFPTSRIPYTHTVIVENYEGEWLLVVDPLAEPKEIRLSEFLESWGFYVTWLLSCAEDRADNRMGWAHSRVSLLLFPFQCPPSRAALAHTSAARWELRTRGPAATALKPIFSPAFSYQ